MNTLSKDEKDIILDFYFRCGSDERINAARDMIASDPRAAQLYASLENTLQSLDHVKYEPCPDNLAELTVARLRLAASSEQARLESLLAEEQRRTEHSISGVTTKRSFWRNIAEVAAVAAVFLVLIGVWVPVTKSLQQRTHRIACNDSMRTISAGFGGYAGDHNGSLPAVEMSPGSPWWKVGNQGKENQSNTRHIWLLVKDGYVELDNFICPGREDTAIKKFDIGKAASLSDFPNREAMSYSFKFMANDTAKKNAGSRMVLLSDLNPVFENVFSENAIWDQSSTFRKLLVSEQLREMMSSNHKNKGQNVLLGDGSSEFQKSRVMFGDDIFTVKGKSVYSGCEVPSDNQDIFLAP